MGPFKQKINPSLKSSNKELKHESYLCHEQAVLAISFISPGICLGQHHVAVSQDICYVFA